MYIKEIVSNKFPFFSINLNNKKYYLKKFKQFVSSIIKIKKKVIDNIECNFPYEKKLDLILKTFLKRCASSYLRLDCIQELLEYINK